MRKLLILTTAFVLAFGVNTYAQRRVASKGKRTTAVAKRKAGTVRRGVKKTVKPQAGNTATLLIRKPGSTLYDYNYDKKTQAILNRDGSTWGLPESYERIQLVVNKEENRIKALTAQLLNGRDEAQTEALKAEMDSWEKLENSFNDVKDNAMGLNVLSGAGGGLDFDRYALLKIAFYRRACLEDDALAFEGKPGLNGTSTSPVDASKLLDYANTSITSFDYQKLDSDFKESLRDGGRTNEYKATYAKLVQNITVFKSCVNNWVEARANVAKTLPDGYSLFYDSDTYKVINSLTERSKYNFLPTWLLYNDN